MRVLWLILISSILFAVASSASDAADSDLSKPFPPYRLRPVDESARDPDFRAFHSKLSGAIERKDFAFLLSIIDPKIELSFGGDAGISRFEEIWKPKDKKSPIWTELGEVLRLGGTFNRQGEFWAPYVFSRFPENYDGFDYSVIIGTDVKVRKEPKSSAPAIATLNYDIVRTTEWDRNEKSKTPPSWLKVGLSDGREGFVPAATVRSPIGYRAGFAKKDGKWTMTVFIAGD